MYGIVSDKDDKKVDGTYVCFEYCNTKAWEGYTSADSEHMTTAPIVSKPL